MAKLKIIANPISGSGKVKLFLERLSQALADNNIPHDTCLTAGPGDATIQAQSALRCGFADTERPVSIGGIGAPAAGYTALLCLGGDGTINEVINGLMSAKTVIPLGIIPFGSGNVIAKALGIKRSIKQFIQLYQAGQVRTLDVGRISGENTAPRYFISMAGAGYDAEVAHRYHHSRAGKSKLQAHLFSYLPIGLGTLATYQMPRIAIEIDGRLVTQDATFVQVANAHTYGGPFMFTPDARLDDGLLDILWFTGKSRLHIPLYFTLALLGNGSLAPDAHLVRGKKVVLTNPTLLSGHSHLHTLVSIPERGKVLVQVDGDYCGQLPVQIDIRPSALTVFT